MPLRHPLPTGLGILAALAVLALGSLATAGLSDAEFRRAQTAATKLMRAKGESVTKLRLVRDLGSDESERALALLIRWSTTSRSLQQKRLAPEAEKRQAAYQKYRDKVLKKHDGSAAGWSTAERERVKKRKLAWKDASYDVSVEEDVRHAIAAVVRETKDPDVVSWIARTGIPMLLAGQEYGAPLEAAFERVLSRPASVARTAVLAVLARPIDPTLRIRGLAWIEREKPKDAAGELTPCLMANAVPVRRAAVRALAALDDPRSVPSLIQALESATGLLATEIEALLHRFTGRTFSKDGKAWRRWWEAAGSKWLQRENKKRYPEREDPGDLSFYGINTPSDRVVFVLDRSGSMAAPAIVKGHQGPTTTPQPGKESAAGKTRLDIAKAELRKAVTGLGTDVKFNLIFYDHNVKTWRAPRALVPATAENKGSARGWFMPLKPGGSTALFKALMKALDYTDDFGGGGNYAEPGVDTIFLLSDGAPTTFDGKLLTPEEIDTGVEKFLAANSVHRCIVHTVGIGRQHNVQLMKRIAEATGGTYVAVGMD